MDSDTDHGSNESPRPIEQWSEAEKEAVQAIAKNTLVWARKQSLAAEAAAKAEAEKQAEIDDDDDWLHLLNDTEPKWMREGKRRLRSRSRSRSKSRSRRAEVEAEEQKSKQKQKQQEQK